MQLLSIFATAFIVFAGATRGASVYQDDTDLIARGGAPEPSKTPAVQPPPAKAPVPKENVGASCFNGVHALLNGPGSRWITPLANACQNWVAKNNTELWSNKICVAAAGVSSPTILRNFDVCVTGAFPTIVIPSQKNLKSLDYNVYANIVGGCAFQKGGCPMTQQNFIDLVYSSISAFGGTEWPSSAQEVIDHWNIIKKWAATGNTVPYLNFNDWLHFFTAF
ncbi:hypothetical protein FISHEDRAFT_73206 [Fistulina hepatica ATCC 64428]|uniref:Uncharacterized protein n=1 Tax=Fistulina hepatica ATCC 64428 TaxID=1128425 RepID=A0A0D7AG68_9AGAR|nr:hypothetical protein FISHEDRAFT_73206 [Fistulina hepatica ATCC 64428]